MQLYPSKLVRAIVPLIAILLLASPLAQGRPAAEEIRVSLKLAHLREINRDRARHGLKPVQLDSFASGIADAYCERQIRERTTGHFVTDGQAPYMRYSFAGGKDGVSENAAAWSANYRFTETMLPDLIQQSHRAMMAEVAPHDGHRRTILDPGATHVGIGIAWDGGEFRLAQEFVRRYVDWTRTPPREVATGEHALIAGRTFDGYRLEAISVHREAHPQSLSSAAANLIDSYRLPSARRDYLPARRSQKGVKVGRKGAFSLAVPFSDGPGVYTIVVWVRGASEKPIPASNISVRVHGPGSSTLTSVAAR